MITLEQYFMGHERDPAYGNYLTPDIRDNAARLLPVVNGLLLLAHKNGVLLYTNPKTKSLVSSGWRPPAVNASTPGAAPNSLHMICRAIDIYDPEGDLDEWLVGVTHTYLTGMGLWLEHPAATKGWAHLQDKAPRSGRRVFYP